MSHWFVCYHLTTPPPPGSLTVRKTVIAPTVPAVTPPPTTFTALVNCDDGEHTNIPVTFAPAGVVSARRRHNHGHRAGDGLHRGGAERRDVPTRNRRCCHFRLGANTAGVTIEGTCGSDRDDHETSSAI